MSSVLGHKDKLSQKASKGVLLKPHISPLTHHLLVLIKVKLMFFRIPAMPQLTTR